MLDEPKGTVVRRSELLFDFRRTAKPIALAVAVVALAAVCAVLPEVFATLPHSPKKH